MSLSVSDPTAPRIADFVIIGDPGDRRTVLFQHALSRLDLPTANIIPYGNLLVGRVELPQVVTPGTVVRIESPSRDFLVNRLILAAGAEAASGLAVTHIARPDAERLAFDKGRILYPHQWYLGFCQVLDLISGQLARCPEYFLMNDPDEIKAMFDKPASHQRLQRAGIPVPPAIGPVSSFDQLVECMRQSGERRVFVKLAYGSSASGVVAYRTNGKQSEAISTVEMVRQDGELCLYNSRHIRVYRDTHQIAELIDALCQHKVHVERWLPKAGIHNRAFDLRVVVIDDQARHVVVRQSRSPMTNLHLLNARGKLETVLERLGADNWEAACHACERAMACFPNSLYGGVDLLITSDFRQHAILEVNAFGDLIPGILHQGVDTYTAEILAILERIP